MRTIINLIFAVFILMTGIHCGSKKKQPPALIELASPANELTAEPFLFTGENGAVYLSWVKEVDDRSEMYFARLTGNHWSPPMQIDSGRNWFVNWADFPMMATNKNHFIASYLDKSGAGKYSYDIKYKVSSDSGRTWSQAKWLNEDGKDAEHGFTSFTPYGENFFVSWLDGRNTASEETSHHHEGHPGAMSVRGAVVNGLGEKLQEWELDARTCDCCNTCSAITKDGPVVVYRDRSEEEVRDISITRMVDGKWTAPKLIYADNWTIKGCPVNGPRAVAKGNNLAIAWFSMPNNEPQVKVTFSDDGGESFLDPVRIDQGKAIGRIDLEMLDDGSVFALWMEGSNIMGANVTEDGVRWKMLISASSEARSSGFPQVTKSGHRLIVAWTDNQQKSIRTAIINL